LDQLGGASFLISPPAAKSIDFASGTQGYRGGWGSTVVSIIQAANLLQVEAVEWAEVNATESTCCFRIII
jgi:hypothetical protein